MKYGICRWADIALRATPSHRSEMVSQLLFGETYQLLEEAADWIKISTTDCRYEGWISRNQHREISEEECLRWTKMPMHLVRERVQYIRDIAHDIAFPIYIGSQHPETRDGRFTLAGSEYIVERSSSPEIHLPEGLSAQQEALLTVAFRYLNAPYLWGGRTPAGIDCSGFTQNVFRSIGISLPRDASQQVAAGNVVDFVEEARIGDIAFFENDEGAIIHVGIVCAPNQIIHASGIVQINTLDNTGIFHQEFGKYTHKLRIIKRVL